MESYEIPALPSSVSSEIMLMPALAHNVSRSMLLALSIMLMYCDFMKGSDGKFIMTCFQIDSNLQIYCISRV